VSSLPTARLSTFACRRSRSTRLPSKHWSSTAAKTPYALTFSPAASGSAKANASEDAVVLATCGALVPETLEAAKLLEREEGVAATVLCLSSPDRLYRDWRERRLTSLRHGKLGGRSHLELLVAPAERSQPLVTAIDGASHSLAFLGSCLGMRTIPLGVDAFGQSGSQPDVYEAYDLSPAAIATAALVALNPSA
jgi:pyruvate dehydrogenase E1 component